MLCFQPVTGTSGSMCSIVYNKYELLLLGAPECSILFPDWWCPPGVSSVGGLVSVPAHLGRAPVLAGPGGAFCPAPHLASEGVASGPDPPLLLPGQTALWRPGQDCHLLAGRLLQPCSLPQHCTAGVGLLLTLKLLFHYSCGSLYNYSKVIPN